MTLQVTTTRLGPLASTRTCWSPRPFEKMVTRRGSTLLRVPSSPKREFSLARANSVHGGGTEQSDRVATGTQRDRRSEQGEQAQSSRV